jgi:uridylate kinase
MSDSKSRYERVLLKLSGEALVGEQSLGIHPGVLRAVAKEVHDLSHGGVETAVVIGGGNIFRGLNCAEYGLGRVPADYMGMLATVMNAIALGEVLNTLGSESRVMSAIEMKDVAEPYLRNRALRHLKRKRVVLLGAGTGNPFFSTDTAAALRAMELDAQVLLKATKVDGVYEADPLKDPSAKCFKTLTYQEVLEKGLKVMDLTAVSLAMGQKLPIIVFNLMKEGNIGRVISGGKVGTLIWEGNS